MVYRHPCILKYVSHWRKGSKFHLATEQVQPLAQVLPSQTSLQICVGLQSVLKALVFLHESVSSLVSLMINCTIFLIRCNIFFIRVPSVVLYEGILNVLKSKWLNPSHAVEYLGNQIPSHTEGWETKPQAQHFKNNFFSSKPNV